MHLFAPLPQTWKQPIFGSLWVAILLGQFGKKKNQGGSRCLRSWHHGRTHKHRRIDEHVDLRGSGAAETKLPHLDHQSDRLVEGKIKENSSPWAFLTGATSQKNCPGLGFLFGTKKGLLRKGHTQTLGLWEWPCDTISWNSQGQVSSRAPPRNGHHVPGNLCASTNLQPCSRVHKLKIIAILASPKVIPFVSIPVAMSALAHCAISWAPSSPCGNPALSHGKTGKQNPTRGKPRSRNQETSHSFNGPKSCLVSPGAYF